MSQTQKRYAEQKHRLVQNYLEKQFPACEVKYNGLEGLDHAITFNGKTVYIETKTCKRTIKGGLNRLEGRPFIEQTYRMGRFRFNKEQNIYPYKKSQHEDLVDLDGWYIFVVGYRIRGIKAKEVDEFIKGNWTTKRITWDKVMYKTRPDWLENLKSEVYGVKK